MLSIAAWAIVWSLIPHPPLTSPPVPQQQASAQSYSVDGEIGLSAVFVDVNGSEEKYRSDYNYTPGFNLRSFALNLSSEEPGQTLVDFLNLQGSGFGDSDPSEQAVLSFGRRGSFEFNGRYWKQDFFSSLPSYALGSHLHDNARRVFDLNLRIYPHPRWFVELGYVRNSQYGTFYNSDEAFRNLVEVSEPRRSTTQDFRVGVSYHGPVLQAGVTQNFRKFKDDPERTENRLLEPGTLPEIDGTEPVRLSIPSTSFLVRVSPSASWSVDGRYVYSDGRAESTTSDFLKLALSETLDLEEIVKATSVSDRPEHRATVTATFNLTDQLVFSNTFRLHVFDIEGMYAKSLTFPPSQPNAGELVLEEEAVTDIDYRLWRNRPQLEFFINQGFSVYGGYDYSDRLVEETLDPDRQVRIAHLGFGGASWRPYDGARLNLEFEKGTANNAFAVTEPRRQTRFRFSSHLPLGTSLTLSPHFLYFESSNPGGEEEFESDSYQAGVEAHYAEPDGRLSVTAGYTFFDLKTLTDIRFALAGIPQQGTSRYDTQLHFGHALGVIPIKGSLAIRLGYRLLLDPDGSSFPLTRHEGMGGLEFKTGESWWWQLEWNYVSYDESLADFQDYTANRLSVTVRRSF